MSDLKMFAPVILLILVVSVCGRLLLREASALLDLRELVATEKERQISPEEMRTTLVELKQKNLILEQRLDSLRSNLAHFRRQDEIVEALTQRIRDSNVSLVALKPGVTRSVNKLDFVPMELSATGHFEQIGRLLFSLESRGNNYRIHYFSVQLARKGVKKVELRVEMDIILNHQRDLENAS